MNSYCIDRVRFPCPLNSHLTNVTCSNPRHDCCASPLTSPSSLSLYISSNSKLPTWNLLIPIYYFAFHGTSKWDKYFFNSWLQTGSDLSHDFINDEFLFSCTGIFVDSLVFLTHESCLPTQLTSEDKRSILFSLIPKKDQDNDEYDKVALQIQTYQIYSPFQLVRLAYRHDFLANKTYEKLNSARLNDESIHELSCVIVFNEQSVQQIRLVNNFERQFIFNDDNNNNSLFAFINNNDDDEQQWTFLPIICLLKQDTILDWSIVGISGKQLKHKCKIVNHIKYCQMSFVYANQWF